MKLKEYFYMLGFKPRERRYGYRVKQFDIASFGIVEYAQWTHPSEKDKFIREDVVSYLKSFLENGDFCIDIRLFQANFRPRYSVVPSRFFY
jgi:hypothetical protein